MQGPSPSDRMTTQCVCQLSFWWVCVWVASV